MALLSMTIIPPGAGGEPVKASRPFDVLALLTSAGCLFVIVVAVLAEAGIAGHPTTFLEGLALAALVGLGVAVPGLRGFSQQAADTRSIEAAHARLDAIAAPPATGSPPTP